MTRRPLFALLALTALLAPSASCRCSCDTPQQAPKTLADMPLRLPNGLTVNMVTGPCGDSAVLVVLLDVGLNHDPAGRSGMARLAARILSTSVGAGHAERTVETGSDYTLYSVAVPADRLLPEVDAVAAWMSQFAPTEADLARERAHLLEDLGKLQGADAAATAKSLAEEAVLPTRGNGKRLGIAAEVQAITLAELQAFWKAHFKPGNARIAVAGRFDEDKVRGRIEAALGPLPAGTPPVLREAANATVAGTLVMGDAPKAVAVAVVAPALSDPLYAPFLVLASRLLTKSDQPGTWAASYDPIRRPEILFVTGPVGSAEQPEPAAARMRAEVATLLARPPAPREASAVRERFRLLVEPQSVDPALCARDARAFAVARVRGAKLVKDGAALVRALDATTKEQLSEAAGRFDTKRSAAVIAGGALR